MNRYRPLWLALFSAGLLSCGGGDKTSALVDVPQAVVQLTSTNMASAAGMSMGGSQSTNDSGQSGQVQSNAVAAGVAVDSAHVGAATFGRRQLSRVIQGGLLPSTEAPLPTAVVSTLTFPCEVSGTFSLDFDDVTNNGVLDAGDSFSMVFQNCQDASGRSSGSMVLKVTGSTGDYGVAPWSYDAEISFKSLTLGSGVINGSMTMALNNNDGVVDTFTYQGSLLGFYSAGEGVELTGYKSTGTYDASTGETVFSSNATISSTQLGGSVSYVTVTPLKQLDTDSYPYAGELKITGKNNSTVSMLIVDANTVQLDADFDGDGVIDEAGVVKTWAEIGAQPLF